MIRKIFFFLFCLVLTTAVKAGEVSEAEALQKAKAFMAGRGIQLTSQAKLRLGIRRLKASQQNAASYYVFNVAGEGGFVIVSGDDRTVPILGYADTGNVSEDNMPEALRYMLDGYSRQMEWLDGQPDEACEAKPRKVSAVRTAVSPLITTRWNQGAPYNNLCPELSGDNGGKVVTGCVATAMAQLMYFYKCPEVECKVIPGYTVNIRYKDNTTEETHLDELPATSFNWSAMTNTYASGATGPAAEAVAKLMQYCGWSLQMTYGVSVSSAYNESIVEALKLYFDYDASTRHAYRKHYSYQEWVDLIYSELSDGHPVILGGQAVGSGHSFVCDGYDTDDYFHINWGWGGSSDGYYRLSALNPWEQGIGGSSSLDGFSYGQDAVIARPTADGSPAYCLSLEGLRFGASDTNASKTFTRNATTDDFTGISLYLTLFCYQFGTNSFDYTVQLVDGSGTLVHTLHTGTMESEKFNANIAPTFNDLSIPSSVADGTYYIKVMSRPSGTTGWQECYDGDQFQLTATISGTDLTIDVPRPTTTKPAGVTFTINGNKTLGYEQEVIASVTGGAAEYRGELFLYVNDKLVMGKTVEISAGQTADVRFVYTPSESDANVLKIKQAKSVAAADVIGSTTIDILTSDADNTQELTIVPTFNNLADGKLYGNAVRATVRVTNPSTDNSFVSTLNCSLREYDNISDAADNYVNATVQSKSITVAKSASPDNLSYTDIDFDYDGLNPAKCYRLRFSYSQGYTTEKGEKKKRTADGPITDCYAVGGGYALYAPDGTATISPETATVEAGSALCVDLTSFNDFTGVTITPSTNPNCLYLFAENADVPATLDGCNVVKGGVATTLTLTDGNDFYTPISFTANEASYTRTFTRAANGTNGWNTIMVPFAVTEVTCDGKAVDWFHSSTDTGKNFWLKTFTGDESGSVYFDFTDALQANTSYIIAVPDDRWGTEWQMTGKPVTFRGTNVPIAATETVSTSGDNYKFCGDTRGTTVTKAYALNAEGSSFKYSEDAVTIAAFRAWFEGVSISSLTMPALGIANGPFTGITAITADEPTAATAEVYDLSGRRVTGSLRPGIYIVGGKKKVILK